MTTRQRVAVHSLGTGTPEATVHVGAKRGTSAGTSQAFVDIPAFVLGTAVVTIGTFALVRAR